MPANHPRGKLDLRDERAPEPLRDRDGVANVVVVAVRDDEEIAALGLSFPVGAGRVAGQERVDVDARTGRRVHPERGVTQPGECGSHVVEPSREARIREPQERSSGVYPAKAGWATWHSS